MLEQDINSKYLYSLVSSWVKKEILYQKAKQMHFDTDEIIQLKTDDYFKDLVVDSFIKYHFQSNVSIDEAEIRNFYLKNKKSFIRIKDEAKVSHVIINDYNEAKKILSVLKSHNQAEKSEIFTKYKFETKNIKRGESIEQIGKTIFEMTPHNIVGPIVSPYGYHIVQIHKRYKKGSLRPIDEVRDEIFHILAQNKMQQNYISLVDSMMETTDYDMRKDKINKILGGK